jgi:hypothetical protein
MPIDRKLIGRSYGPFLYDVGGEKMREFAWAIAGGVPSSSFAFEPPYPVPKAYYDRVHLPPAERMAPPTFCVTFNLRPFASCVTDPDLRINLLALVHGEQEYQFHHPVRPGDVLSTVGTLRDVYEKSGKEFLVLESDSTNQAGQLAVRGIYTAVIRL